MAKLLSNPDNKVISSLLHPVSCEQKESKGFVGLGFFYQLFAEHDADSCMYWNPMAVPAVQKQRSENRASLGGLLLPMLANRGIIFLAREQAARREIFPTCFNPNKSHPQEVLSPHSVFLGSVLFLGKQLQGRGLHAWGHPRPSAHLAVSWASPGPCRHRALLRTASPGHCLQMAYLQVGPAGPKGGLGSSLNHTENTHRDEIKRSS